MRNIKHSYMLVFCSDWGLAECQYLNCQANNTSLKYLTIKQDFGSRFRWPIDVCK